MKKPYLLAQDIIEKAALLVHKKCNKGLKISYKNKTLTMRIQLTGF